MTQTPINPLGRPEQPSKFRPRITEEPNFLEVSFAKRDWGMAVFMIFWLMPWSAGCLAMLKNAMAGQMIFMFMCVPFCAAWLFVVMSLIDAIVRVEKIVIDRQAALYTWRVIFNLQKSTYLAMDLKPVNNTLPEKNINGTYRLKLRGRDKDLECFKGLTEEEARWLQPIINAHLARIAGYETGVRPTPTDSPFPSSASEQDVQDWHARQADSATSGEQTIGNTPGDDWITQGPVPLRPADTKWEVEPSFQELKLVNKGSFSLKAFLVLLFFTLFWDGIVFTVAGAHLGLFSNTVTTTQSASERVFVLIFLTPFVVVGLVLLLMLFASLLSGTHKKKWLFGYRGIQYKSGYLGIGKTQEWDVVRLKGLQIKAGRFAETAQSAGVMELQKYDLLFIDRADKEVCKIPDLSLEEARWIGSQVMNSRKEWFR